MTRRGGPQRIPRPADWRPGGPAPWSDHPNTVLSVADIAERLARYEPGEIHRGRLRVPEGQQGRPSAVLIGLYDGPEGATTILTRRPQHMRKHAGEVAFPGGGVDDTDESVWAAATREAQEEVGLDPDLVEPIGELDRFVTGASFSLVTPMVGVVADLPELTPSPDEVEEILHVPISELLLPEVYREEEWRLDETWYSIHFFELIGDTMWGATAVMVRRLLEVIVDYG